jgi:hypothetical protein
MKCFAFPASHASGPCKHCRETVDAPLHVVGEDHAMAMYCPAHCICCNPQLAPWDGITPRTITGVQEELF